jgi:multidrug efflux pump subunit AcrB
MLIATTSISGMFFPMLGLMTGTLADFIKLFPWAIFIALSCSILYAVWIIPYMAASFIRPKPAGAKPTVIERIQNKFFAALQNGYQKLLDLCFRHPWATIVVGLASVVVGGFIVINLNIQLMPKANRDSFAVEIHLTEGSSLDQTQAVVDSLGKVFTADKRVESVTAFVGSSSPRFHATYAPQIGGENYAQFIVNTISSDATVELVEEYQPLYEDAFPNAFCRFKRLDYQSVPNAIEINVQGSDFGKLEVVADSLKAFMAGLPDLSWVHSDYDETVQTIRLRLKDDEASRLGVTQASLSLYLNGVLRGRRMTAIWQDGYKVPVVLYTEGADSLNYSDIGNTMIPTLIPGLWVPLRQVAEIEPDFHHAQIKRRNSIRTITVAADTRGKIAAIGAMKPVIRYVRELEKNLPEGVRITYGGALEHTMETVPGLVMSVLAALLVLLVLLVYHFKKLNIAFLSLSSSLLCLFGAAFGLWMFDQDFSITAILGVISLIGIIVRNAIIMYEYADFLVTTEHITARDAAYLAGQRRMRPIFLTTATTALGVVPMILAATDLWMPMGVVICFGAIITMPMVVTILPVAYWKLFEKSTRKYEK